MKNQIPDVQTEAAWNLGYLAFKNKEKISDNPFKKNTVHYHWWILGFTTEKDS